jgi:hypothetical protein
MVCVWDEWKHILSIIKQYRRNGELETAYLIAMLGVLRDGYPTVIDYKKVNLPQAYYLGKISFRKEI